MLAAASCMYPSPPNTCTQVGVWAVCCYVGPVSVRARLAQWVSVQWRCVNGLVCSPLLFGVGWLWWCWEACVQLLSGRGRRRWSRMCACLFMRMCMPCTGGPLHHRCVAAASVITHTQHKKEDCPCCVSVCVLSEESSADKSHLSSSACALQAQVLAAAAAVQSSGSLRPPG